MGWQKGTYSTLGSTVSTFFHLKSTVSTDKMENGTDSTLHSGAQVPFSQSGVAFNLVFYFKFHTFCRGTRVVYFGTNCSADSVVFVVWVTLIQLLDDLLN